MKYISTRGQAPSLDFEGVTLTGLANDGGLYVPEHWPTISHELQLQYAKLDYVDLAAAILSHFSGDSLNQSQIHGLASQAYSSFHHSAIVPLKQLDHQLYFMELFHGPTLAFKDCALQLLGQFFAHFLEKNQQTCTIVGATSGDTGSAAIAGVSGIERVQLYMLHPHGRVSEVQRRQMTTVHAPNIHNLALHGNFDDCQNLVKAMFNDADFRAQHNLSAVNSINWARIAAQVVYYFRAAFALGAPHRAVNFAVPTGNFGNILAGYVAKQMGLPIHRLIIGSNVNDILTRFIQTGAMKTRDVVATITPSMDIQISSNFERYLFELMGHDSDKLRDCMQKFATQGEFQVDDAILATMREQMGAYRFTDEEINHEIARLYEQTGEIIDPHSAIGVAAARQELSNEIPTIVLGTAHAAKFPDAIENAIGLRPALPTHVAHIMHNDEYVSELPNDLQSVQAYINQHNKAR